MEEKLRNMMFRMRGSNTHLAVSEGERRESEKAIRCWKFSRIELYSRIKRAEQALYNANKSTKSNLVTLECLSVQDMKKQGNIKSYQREGKPSDGQQTSHQPQNMPEDNEIIPLRW